MQLTRATFTSLQISQLALHAQYSWILAFLQGAAWPRPSSCWRCMPASHALRLALTPPASHWAHLQCPTDACREKHILDKHWQSFVFYTAIHLTACSACSGSPGLIGVDSIQHGSCKLQVPPEFLQVHHAMVHLLQDRLQPDNTNTVHYTWIA